jgi:hypothetical protein
MAPSLITDPAVDAAVKRVHAIMSGVFDTVGKVRQATLDQIEAARRSGREPLAADLEGLRPLLFSELRDAIAGLGFIAAPGLLPDEPWFLEWWQPTPSGQPVQLIRDLDPTSSAFYDYTHWDWYTGPSSGAERTICGPFVDYLCTDDYGFTFSVPVRVEGAFIGVAAADMLLRSFEAAVAPALRRIPVSAFVVNSSGRVITSNTARWLAGTVFRGAPGVTTHPIGDLPLSLVTIAGRGRTSG